MFRVGCARARIQAPLLGAMITIFGGDNTAYTVMVIILMYIFHGVSVFKISLAIILR
jgi:hypothetical protein